MMKKTWIILTALFCCWMKSEAAQAPAAGFIIYTDHPSTYVEACEYTALNSGGPLYSTIQRVDGKQLQINRGGLWVMVDYPVPPAPGEEKEAKDVASSNLAKIQVLLQKFPQFKAQLTAAQTKWQHALESATTAEQPGAAAPNPPKQVVVAAATTAPAPTVAAATQPAEPPKVDTPDGKLNFATKDGTKYNNAVISRVDAQGITFETDAGIEHINFDQLPKELQARFHYDPAKAALAQDAEWGVNYAAALERAKAANKLVLLNFTGSDWCPWCIKMKQETLDQQAFREYAAQHLVLVELDFPNNVPQGAALKEQNAALKGKFSVTGFPTFVVVDKYGDVKQSMDGYLPGGPQAFIAWLDKSRKP